MIKASKFAMALRMHQQRKTEPARKARPSPKAAKPRAGTDMPFAHLAPPPAAPAAAERAQAKAERIVAAAARAAGPIKAQKPAKGSMAAQIIAAGNRARRPTGDGTPAAVRVARRASR